MCERYDFGFIDSVLRMSEIVRDGGARCEGRAGLGMAAWAPAGRAARQTSSVGGVGKAKAGGLRIRFRRMGRVEAHPPAWIAASGLGESCCR